MNYCTVCDSLKIRKIDKELNLFVCQKCTHFFSLPETQEKYTEEYYIKDHENWFLHPNYEYFKKISELIHKFTQKSNHQFSTLLDVGCGKGDFLKFFLAQEPNMKLTGIDITNNADKKIQFIIGDVMRYDFKKKYSIITAFMIIEHVSDLKAFVNKLKSLLLPNGIIIISTINNHSLLYWIARMLNRIGLRDSFERVYSYHHLQHFSPKSLKYVLTNAGFTTQLQLRHNYSLNAVDVPKRHWLITKAYLFAVRLIFFVSKPLGLGIHQTIVCTPHKSVMPPKR